MAYPSTGYPVTEFLINGVWTDVSSYVRQEDGTQGIAITRAGRSGEQGRPSPSTSDFKLNNRDGRFSNRNPTGAYYGLLPRNTQVRHSAGTGDTFMRTTYDDQNASDRAETADKAVLDITGDLEVRADIWPHTWQPINGTNGTVTSVIIASKYLISGEQRSWALYLAGSGLLALVWSTDGTAAGRVFAVSTAGVPATTGRLSIKVTLDVNNGAAGNTVAFYTASSITGTYTQLGSNVVTAGTTSIFSGSGKLCAGSGDDLPGIFTGAQRFGGRFYGLRVYNGIAGTEVARFDPTGRTIGDTSWSDGLGTPNTWSIAGHARVTSDRVRFWGELASLPQAWDKTGTDVYMPIQGAGLLRRLGVSGSALKSAMRRKFSTLTGIAGYWPFEDGAAATSAASAVSGGYAAKVASTTFQADTTLPGADGSARFSSTLGSVVMQPAVLASTGTLVFTGVVNVSALPASQKVLFSLYTTGTARRIDVGMDGSNWKIELFDGQNSSLGSTLTAIGTVSPLNQWMGYSLRLLTSGGNFTYDIKWHRVGGSFGLAGPSTLAGSVGSWSTATIKAAGETAYADAGFAHFHLANVDYDFQTTAIVGAFAAYTGETAAARLARLSAEEGVTMEIQGNYSLSALMGPQTTDTYINNVYACSDADGGILSEARDALALSYRTANDLTARRDVTLSQTSSQLSDVPLPTEDDLNVVNDVTVSSDAGTSARYVKSTGALSTAAPPAGAGRYATTPTLNLDDSALSDAAGWLVHLGTWDGTRIPNLSIGMHRTQITGDSALSEQLRALDVGDTVTLTGMPTWMPPDDLPLIVQGYSEVLCPKLWDIVANTTPAGPYAIGRYNYADAAGTTRWGLNSSTLNTAIDTSATTIKLDIVSTDPWTVTAGSYPFDIMMAGERITLTAAPGGSTTPQTFTGCTRSVNGVVKSHFIGEAVTLADTRYYSR